jgi:predicted adenine nucleotide alpha hydrolase (AANH) superfamily ATPase
MIPMTTWNYKGQDVKTYRHYGPMAQDFYKAFGRDRLGEIGCDTLINQQDFIGVNFIAVKALEERTHAQQKEIDELKKQVQLIIQKN